MTSPTLKIIWSFSFFLQLFWLEALNTPSQYQIHHLLTLTLFCCIFNVRFPAFINCWWKIWGPGSKIGWISINIHRVGCMMLFLLWLTTILFGCANTKDIFTIGSKKYPRIWRIRSFVISNKPFRSLLWLAIICRSGTPQHFRKVSSVSICKSHQNHLKGLPR